MRDAEMLLGLHRHLANYIVAPATSALGSLQFAGKLFDLAFRLRGSGVSRSQRVQALAVDAGITTFELNNLVIPTLESLLWIRVNRNSKGEIVSIEDVVPPIAELIEAGDKVLSVVGIDDVQSSALAILRASTLHPLEKTAALEAASEFGDESAEDALRFLESVNLVRVIDAADGRTAVFNPNVWVDDEIATKAALRIEDSKIRKEVGALMEEVRARPGLPQDRVTSTERRWVDFAVSQGLIERSVVATSTGEERGFLFSPHLHRDTFGNSARAASGHVRQLVGSMIYAATYPRYKLDDPALFVQRLIERGRAGNASPIGTDYPMLETAGIVQVVEGRGAGRFSLELRQSDVAEGALEILKSTHPTNGVGAKAGLSGLFAQKSYRHVEGERARLATTVGTDDKDMSRLVAALRVASRRGNE